MIRSKYDNRYKEIGRKVAQYRSAAGYTQEDFANKLGISYSYIAQIEAPNQVKRMSLEVLFEIAEALNIDIKDLLWKYTLLVNGYFLFLYFIKHQHICLTVL